MPILSDLRPRWTIAISDAATYTCLTEGDTAQLLIELLRAGAEDLRVTRRLTDLRAEDS